MKEMLVSKGLFQLLSEDIKEEAVNTLLSEYLNSTEYKYALEYYSERIPNLIYNLGITQYTQPTTFEEYYLMLDSISNGNRGKNLESTLEKNDIDLDEDLLQQLADFEFNFAKDNDPYLLLEEEHFPKRR